MGPGGIRRCVEGLGVSLGGSADFVQLGSEGRRRRRPLRRLSLPLSSARQLVRAFGLAHPDCRPRAPRSFRLQPPLCPSGLQTAFPITFSACRALHLIRIPHRLGPPAVCSAFRSQSYTWPLSSEIFPTQTEILPKPRRVHVSAMSSTFPWESGPLSLLVSSRVSFFQGQLWRCPLREGDSTGIFLPAEFLGQESVTPPPALGPTSLWVPWGVFYVYLVSSQFAIF